MMPVAIEQRRVRGNYELFGLLGILAAVFRGPKKGISGLR
jgi:hypothetical protein